MSNRRQPQRLPPPIMHGGEAIESEVVLREVPNEIGVLLWKTVRSVRLRAELSESDRPHAFETGGHRDRVLRIREAPVPEEIRAPLARAAAVLQPRARSAPVAAACRALAEWAEREGALGTAIELLQAAAVTVRTDPELAYEVARLARARTEYQRAETWYRQAVSRARRAQNRYEFARSYIGLGSVFILRGNYPQARRNLIRGLRAAKRFSIRPLVAAAHQELAVVAIHTGNSADVHRHTRAALDAYGRDPRLASLAYQYGSFLLETGHFAEAFRTITRVPVEPLEPLQRLGRAAALVRAAGANGDRESYDTAWAAAEPLLRDPTVAEGSASALLAMARGAVAIGEAERARTAAARAERLASERGEAEVEFAAAEVLEAIASGVSRTPAVEPRRSSPRVRGLVEDLEAALAEG